jgi:hypothetical protein
MFTARYALCILCIIQFSVCRGKPVVAAFKETGTTRSVSPFLFVLISSCLSFFCHLLSNRSGSCLWGQRIADTSADALVSYRFALYSDCYVCSEMQDEFSAFGRAEHLIVSRLSQRTAGVSWTVLSAFHFPCFNYLYKSKEMHLQSISLYCVLFFCYIFRIVRAIIRENKV